MALAKDGEMTLAATARMLALADKAFATAREVLAMRGQYFSDNVQCEVEGARQMAFLAEKIHDAVHSLSHRTVNEYLNQRLETEAAKTQAKRLRTARVAVAVRATLEAAAAPPALQRMCTGSIVSTQWIPSPTVITASAMTGLLVSDIPL
jgi:hypothetical protein